MRLRVPTHAFLVFKPHPKTMTRKSPFRAAQNGEDFVECPSCLHTMPLSDIPQLTHSAGAERKVKKLWPIEETPVSGRPPTGERTDDEDEWYQMKAPMVALKLQQCVSGDSRYT